MFPVTMQNAWFSRIFVPKAVWKYVSESVTELLGWEPNELVETPSIDLTHPDESAAVRRLH